MSRLVLDSNVAIKWVLVEPHSDKALALRDDFQKGIHELLAPDVFPVEVAHALAKAERRGVVQPGQGQQLLMDVLYTPPDLYPYLPLLSKAYSLASAARVGVYDCLYIALAEQQQCKLLSADDRLQRTFPQQVIPLASLP
jgi:predicted nucleic acid-binding protein